MSLDNLLLKLRGRSTSTRTKPLEELLEKFDKTLSQLTTLLSEQVDASPDSLFPPLKPEKAKDLLADLIRNSSPEEFLLACHAAVPASLTPDLLQTIRASLSFSPYTPQWEHGIRLLLSGQVRTVARATYEMDL